MKKPQPPDFDGQAWIFQYCTDSYWDPRKEDIVHVRQVDPVPKEQRAIAKKLEKFRFAKMYKYHHGNGETAGGVIRPFNESERIKLWGLIGDENNWVQAIMVNGVWRILREGDHWEFGFGLPEDKDRLEYLELFFNNDLIETLQNPEDP